MQQVTLHGAHLVDHQVLQVREVQNDVLRHRLA